MTLIIIDLYVYYSIFVNCRIFFYQDYFFCKIQNIINISQCGFRKGLSTFHVIENLKKVIIDFLIANKYYVGLFIDHKKHLTQSTMIYSLKILNFKVLDDLYHGYDHILKSEVSLQLTITIGQIPLL